MFRLLAVTVAFGLWPVDAAPCASTRQVAPGDTIRKLAESYFGDAAFWPAIVLATNSRISEGFPFVGDLNNIAGLSKLCIPEKDEAQHWRSSYERYTEAIQATALPEPSEPAPKLAEFPSDRPVTVVSWIRHGQIRSFQDASGQWRKKAPTEIWVTVEPYMQKFCSDFVAAHGSDPQQLTERLEQRLGLPPVSSKDKFLEIRLNHPTSRVIFRPCIDPSPNTANCPVGPPAKTVDQKHQQWIFHQYYSSFGQARLESFPWTALGYTFDWAVDENGVFQRIGESEFVIREGAPIEVLRAVDTGDYCRTTSR
jgi:hypothetical protein